MMIHCNTNTHTHKHQRARDRFPPTGGSSPCGCAAEARWCRASCPARPAAAAAARHARRALLLLPRDMTAAAAAAARHGRIHPRPCRPPKRPSPHPPGECSTDPSAPLLPSEATITAPSRRVQHRSIRAPCAAVRPRHGGPGPLGPLDHCGRFDPFSSGGVRRGRWAAPRRLTCVCLSQGLDPGGRAVRAWWVCKAGPPSRIHGVRASRIIKRGAQASSGRGEQARRAGAESRRGGQARRAGAEGRRGDSWGPCVR
jgi:hypothetical protein